MPAEHTLTGVQLAALLVVLNWFASHASHTRSTVAEGVFATNVPAAQMVHAMQEGALSSVENCPFAQDVQPRSVVVDPSLAT